MQGDTLLKALILNCSLSPSPAESSSQLMADQLLDEMKRFNVEGTSIRIADHDVKPGVELDMADGDAWPHIRQEVMEADILIVATPTWMGHMSSLAQRVLERLDAELAETDAEGRLKTFGKVAAVVVVGNEDGAHAVHADLYQGLNDVGFSLAASAGVYWNGEAMHKIDYKDLDEIPEKVATTLKSVATNSVHLARLLKSAPYPPA